jgi:hypothetical protein
MERWKIDEFHFLFRNVICSYGYLTNTKVKFILVTTDLDVKDADVRNVSINKSWWFSFVFLVKFHGIAIFLRPVLLSSWMEVFDWSSSTFSNDVEYVLK